MNVSVKTELPHWCLLLAIGLTSLLALPYAPERMPIHWNAAGEVDGYGSRAVGLGMMPALAAGLYLLLVFIPKIDPGRANFANFAKPYWIIRLAVLALMAVIHLAAILAAVGYEVQMTSIVLFSVGLLLIVLGNYMTKIRPNWFVGVRTPWTLSSKLSWEKTHRQAAWWMIAMGLAYMSCLWIQSAWWVIVAVSITMLSSIWLIAYSYWVWRNDPDKTSPAGVTPASSDDSPDTLAQ